MSTSRPDLVSVPPIVDSSWLRDRLVTDPDIAVWHVGSTMAGPGPQQDFEHRHLPGARFVSLDDVLAAPPSGAAGRHPLPSPAQFAEALGVADNATMIAYDDRGGAFAGRLVWMLRILGQHVALLDGGIEAWATDSDGDVERATVETTNVRRSVHDWSLDDLADAVDVAHHVRDDGAVIGTCEVRFRPTDRRVARTIRSIHRPRRPADRVLRIETHRVPQRSDDEIRRVGTATRVRRIVVWMVRRARSADRDRHHAVSDVTMSHPTMSHSQ